MRAELFEFRQETDRWTNRVVSPLSFESKSDRLKPTVIIHPGWGKKPEILKRLMNKLAEAGVRPLGVDTRFGYADRFSNASLACPANSPNVMPRKYRVSSENPFFRSQSEHDNRYRLRRPTGLAALCLALNIEESSFIGHSEGGRVVTTLVAESSLKIAVPKLIAVNAVGTANNHGVRGLSTSNFRNNELFHGAIDLHEAVLSAIGSTAYMATHPQRSLREKQVIDAAKTGTWDMLDTLVLDRGIDITVMHARDDRLIDYAESETEASTRPHINFVPTEGGHSNIYTPAVTDQLVSLLAA